MSNKKGQIALFVIVAILLVATISLVSYYQGFGPFGVPAKLAPIENRILECLEDITAGGVDILSVQGGYIELPEFEAGSEYAPFSSQLNFFGSVMPYWLYLSSAGEYKEQIPTLTSMEEQLEDYVRENMVVCDMEQFIEQGYVINFEEPENVKVDIRRNEIFTDVEWPITIEFQGTSRRVNSHSVNVKSSLGDLYETALDIYEKQNSRLFLEDYTVDIIALYAPGTGTELTCAPKIWSKSEVKNELLTALQANIPTIRLSGDYYRISEEEREYFVTDIGIDLKGKQVNFFYDNLLPTQIEIEPSSGDVMRADPIGPQEGLGLLGFCYVPYHFVYTIRYPVIVQVFDEDFNLFQFPVVVAVENNQPHGAKSAEAPEEFEVELCKYAVQEYTVNVVDINGRAINDAEISFKCSNTVCPIGKAEGGELSTTFPQCVNGFILARKEGYTDISVQVSTNEEGSAVIVMKPKHELDVRVLKDLTALEKDESALIVFSSEDITQSILYPEQDTIELVEGTYKITAYLFKEGKITLQAQTTQQCVDVIRSGVFGFLGIEREECYTIEQPSQEFDQITIGGGSSDVFLSNEDIAAASFIGIEISSQPTPKTALDLQEVYSNILLSGVGVTLR